MRAVVVGAGIFGSVAAATLKSMGYDVTVLDSKKPMRGSRPAACLMKPSWMTSLDTKKPLALLDELYGVETIKFRVAPLVKVDCFWVNPRSIMSHEVVAENVVSVEDGVVETEEGNQYKGLVVVAAGVWTTELLKGKVPEQRALCGSSIIGTGVVKTPTIHVYAPYRQAVWFNRGPDETWFGDGTALIEKSFTQDRVELTKKRALEMAKIEGRAVHGKRPYLKGSNDGLYQKIGNKTFVLSGGAKNGTILAAHQAVRLKEHL